MMFFALYLPQFHTIPENNQWWGDGFTEWNNVKSATPLFKGHIQPKHPLNNNYYNLLDKRIVEWQTGLLKKYGIDGFIYYHYYFNGKKLLEKPAENLLNWKDIDQPFFFNWANHSWNRAWNGSRELLIEQTYGGIKDWKEHFNYLLPFFKDPRYVKINGSPVFMIYNPSFPEKIGMMKCFDEWCKEEGFSGLYLIDECLSPFPANETQCIENKLVFPTERVYLTQPSVCRQWFIKELPLINRILLRLKKRLNQYGVLKRPLLFDGDKLLKTVIAKEPMNKKIAHGLFFEWDNTPRHKTRGYIITPVKKKTVFEYLDLLKKNEADMVIINAWNEWAEGMMIEPSEERKYTYLEWLSEWKKNN